MVISNSNLPNSKSLSSEESFLITIRTWSSFKTGFYINIKLGLNMCESNK
jgi:hypothetical protein